MFIIFSIFDYACIENDVGGKEWHEHLTKNWIPKDNHLRTNMPTWHDRENNLANKARKEPQRKTIITYNLLLKQCIYSQISTLTYQVHMLIVNNFIFNI